MSNPQVPSDDLEHASFLFGWLPRLDRDERRELSERIAEGAVADADFLVMMGLAATLASLGLLQGSTAVVIGAMLVAPLMNPLIAAGLALVQANWLLFRMALGVIGTGVALGFTISILAGLLNPGYEPSLEIEARGRPDLMDLGIAFASGMAGAYASGRRKVASTLAGVAIAAALVPPLAAIGIALTNDRIWIAGNATILLVTNLVAIVLGSALIYRLLGVRVLREGQNRPVWVRAASISLMLAVVLLSAPLFLNVLEGRRQGQSRPLLYPASPHVREAVSGYVDLWPGVYLIMLGRPSVESDFGMGVILASDDTIPLKFDSGLRKVIDEARGDDPVTRIFVLRSAYPTRDPDSPRTN